MAGVLIRWFLIVNNSLLTLRQGPGAPFHQISNKSLQTFGDEFAMIYFSKAFSKDPIAKHFHCFHSEIIGFERHLPPRERRRWPKVDSDCTKVWKLRQSIKARFRLQRRIHTTLIWWNKAMNWQCSSLCKSEYWLEVWERAGIHFENSPRELLSCNMTCGPPSW